MSTPFKERVTKEQYENAKKHWTKLINGEISGKFDMGIFTRQGGGAEYIINQKNICGTAGCSLGYLPETLQINFSNLEKYIYCSSFNENEINFIRLGEDVLGIPGFADEWNWCFHSIWENIDNTAKGAGIRMRIVYEEGLPNDWDRQFDGDVPLMYKDELSEN